MPPHSRRISVLLLLVLMSLFLIPLFKSSYASSDNFSESVLSAIVTRSSTNGSTTASRTYYVSPSGDDLADGLSPATAWQTLDAINSRDFVPGDTILLEGSQIFLGSIRFTSADCGTAVNPVRVSSYGTGRATIDSGNQHGMRVIDCGGFEIDSLIIVGSFQRYRSGIYVHTNLSGDVKFDHIVINNIDVSGYRAAGITIGSSNDRSGYRDVRIMNNVVHGNGDAGIEAWGVQSASLAGYSHEQLYVAHNQVFDNDGNPNNTTTHTGNGIVLGQVEDTIVEHNEAYNNGAANTYNSGGPIGIWAWDCDSVTIQFNVSHHNRTDSSKDGGGFDLDGGCSNSVMQYNYSYENDGAGYLVAGFGGARPMLNNVIRYNISQNDGQRNGYAGIYLWRAGNTVMDGLDIYHNTIYVSPGINGSPAAFKSISSGIENVQVYNNVFVTTNGLSLLSLQSGSDFEFAGNAYFSSGGTFDIGDSGTEYNSLSAWRNATGQERVNGQTVGFSLNPQLVAPATSGSATNLQLTSISPLIDQALTMSSFGINPGNRDYYGNAVPQGVGPDIGAHETGSSSLPSPTATATETPTATATSTETPTETALPPPTETFTSVPPVTSTPTETPLPEATATETPTEAVPPPPTETFTPVPPATSTPTETPTETALPPPTETFTPVPPATSTPTETPLPEPTATETPTEAVPPPATETFTPVPPPTFTATFTPTVTPTFTSTPAPTLVPTETPTLTPTALSGNGDNLLVYSDGLQSGWEDWSYATSVDELHTSVVYSGTNSLAVTSDPWGGLALVNPQNNPGNGYVGVRFWIHGGETNGVTGGQSLRFYARDINGVDSANEMILTMTANQWQQVTVSFADLGLPDAVRRITWKNISNNPLPTYYVDDIVLLTTLSTPTPTPNATPTFTPTPTATPATSVDTIIYDDELLDGWQDWSFAATTDALSATQVQSGTVAYSVTTLPWGAFSLANPESTLHTDAYSGIRFWLHGGTNGGQPVRFYVRTLEGVDSQMPLVLTPVVGTWTYHEATFDELGSQGVISRLFWKNFSADAIDTYYVDNIAMIPTIDAADFYLDLSARYVPHRPYDVDVDGIADDDEGSIDTDKDGLPNMLDPDADGDGLPDSQEGTSDRNNNLIPDYLEAADATLSAVYLPLVVR